MEIKYIKAHNGNNIGDTESVPEGLGNYLIRCMVAVKNEKQKAKPVDEEKPVVKPKAKKK